MSGAKADDLMAKGRKKRDGFSFFGGGTTKFEDASEMFQQAGNFYKQAKMWKEAAEAYKEAADSQTRAGSQHEAATLLYSSASAYKQAGDAQQAADLLERVVAAYEDMGRFQMAAKHKKEQAEIYERYLPPPLSRTRRIGFWDSRSHGVPHALARLPSPSDVVNLEKATEAYEKAADMYTGENQKSAASACLVKAAQFHALNENYSQVRGRAGARRTGACRAALGR